MEEYFPDVVPLIGKQELKEMWASNPRGALVTIKVSLVLSLCALHNVATWTQTSAQPPLFT